MTTITASGPNAGQIEYWNDEVGHKWVQLQEVLDKQLQELGSETMKRAGIAQGDKVLDVGCGCGHTTLEIARRIGNEGSVLGIDISATMLEVGRRESERRGLNNAAFLNADAQTHSFDDRGFDRLFSRFGVMFFADPAAAFANLRKALRPGATMGFVCWQALNKNPWMAVPVMTAAQHIQFDPPASPHAPGPFAFADADRLHGILDEAGFAGIEISDHASTLTIGGGGTLSQAVEFMIQMGPVGQALRNGKLTEEQTSALTADLHEALAPYHGDDGVSLDAASWMVTATSN